MSPVVPRSQASSPLRLVPIKGCLGCPDRRLAVITVYRELHVLVAVALQVRRLHATDRRVPAVKVENLHSTSSSRKPVGIWASFFRWTIEPRRNLILGIFLPSPVQYKAAGQAALTCGMTSMDRPTFQP